jgi:hypothetical protein
MSEHTREPFFNGTLESAKEVWPDQYDPMIHGSAAAKQGAAADFETTQQRITELEQKLKERDKWELADEITYSRKIADLERQLAEANSRNKDMVEALRPFARMHCNDAICDCHNCTAHRLIAKREGRAT